MNKDQMEMDYYEINLLGCKLIKIKNNSGKKVI